MSRILSTLGVVGEAQAYACQRALVTLSLAVCTATLAAVALLSFPGAAVAEDACSNEQFRTGLGATLPDCRAYEQTTPANKNGGAVEGVPSAFIASADGSGITWFSISASSIPASGGSTAGYPEYLSRRSGSEWLTQRLFPPQLPVGPNAPTNAQNSSYLGSTPDGRFAVAASKAASCSEQRCSTLWVIDTQTEAPTPMVTASGEVTFAFDGASADGSRIFFESTTKLVPEAVGGVDNLYMWNRTTGATSVVGTLSGETPESGAFGGPYTWTEGEVYSGGALNGLAVGADHAMSLSGNQIAFTVPEATGELGQFEFGQLFLRQGLVGGQPSTIRISLPNVGVVNENADMKPAAFQEATPDGAHIFFLSAARLTANATTGPTEEGNDLYRWDRASGQLIDIAPDTIDGNGAQVVGLLGASESGSAGFFVAKGALAPGASPGAPNVYSFSETEVAKFDIRFIATLNEGFEADLNNWMPAAMSPGRGVSTVTGRNSRVDPEARTLLFSSINQLTDFRNESPACGAGGAEGSRPVGPGGEALCVELYRYSRDSQKVVCVSCRPFGPSLGGDAELQSGLIGGPQVPNTRPAAYFTRNLSSNGQRVFFETTEPLVAADTNGGEGCSYLSCLDVYEWEALEEGSCRPGSEAYSSQNGGCLFLISPGQSPSASRQSSYFLDASSDGGNAFIATNNPLLPSDVDEAFDAYDVSAGGGLAGQHPAATRECVGEECQGPSTLPPNTTGPGSAAVAGPGNLHPQASKKRCPKTNRSKHCKAVRREHKEGAKHKHPHRHRSHVATDKKHGGKGGSR